MIISMSITVIIIIMIITTRFSHNLRRDTTLLAIITLAFLTVSGDHHYYDDHDVHDEHDEHADLGDLDDLDDQTMLIMMS